MIICPNCGTQNPDNYTVCPNCGAQLVQQTAPPPVQQPVSMQQPMPIQQPAGYYPPVYQPQEPVTTVGGWFGWSLLIAFLPLIGAIIMLCTVKDPSAKNYAKLIVIMQCIVLAIYLVLFILMVAGGVALSRGF